MKEFIKMLFAGIIVATILTYALFNAVIQESLRNCPPTAEEIAEEPALARYLPE